MSTSQEKLNIAIQTLQLTQNDVNRLTRILEEAQNDAQMAQSNGIQFIGITQQFAPTLTMICQQATATRNAAQTYVDTLRREADAAQDNAAGTKKLHS